MLDVNNTAAFLLERNLIRTDWIVNGALTIWSVPRRNRNLLVRGPGGLGYLLKQPDDPSDGGESTLHAEAEFYEFSRQKLGEVLPDDVIPRLADRDVEKSILVIELVRDAESLDSFFDRERGADGAVSDVSFAVGRALGTIHRVFRDPGLAGEPFLARLSRDVPPVLMAHRPSPGLLAALSRANHQTLRILQTQQGLGEGFDRLRRQWRPETVIHGDVKFDNVLVRPPGQGRARHTAGAWLVDWEFVQFGDPAWDLAGILQDIVRFWTSTMPLSSTLPVGEMVAGAGYPIGSLRGALRSLWGGYRSVAGLAADESGVLLARAVAFSAARLVQTAYEISYESERMSAQSVILLQISANILADPGRGQLHLYGIPRGTPTEMTPLHADLRTALDAVEILSPTRYSLLGEDCDLATADAPDEVGGAAGDRLVSSLQVALYERLYTRPSARRYSADWLARRDLLASLSAANTGKGTWEPGWRVVNPEEDGQVAVAKDGVTYWVASTGFRAEDGLTRPGASCRVKVPKELRNLIPGYYFAVGDSEGDDDDRGDEVEPLLRYYWHLTYPAAPLFMGATTRLFNEAGIPFRVKVLTDQEGYHRADSGVLYVRKRYYGRLGDLVARAHDAVAPGLRSDTPLFCQRLGHGLGLAEDPADGQSFGENRCALVAKALWRAFERGGGDRGAREEELVAQFRGAGLDPSRPHLGPGSGAEYVLRPPLLAPVVPDRLAASPTQAAYAS